MCQGHSHRVRSCALTATLAATVAAVGAPSRASAQASAPPDTSAHALAPTPEPKRAPTGSVHDFDYHVTTFHGRHGFGNIYIYRVPS